MIVYIVYDRGDDRDILGVYTSQTNAQRRVDEANIGYNGWGGMAYYNTHEVNTNE